MTSPTGAEFEAAAREMSEVFATRLGGPGRAVHPETAIAAAARMAGTMLLRSFGLDTTGMPPGGVLLSEQANQHGPMLLNILGAGLTHFGMPPNRAALRDLSDRGREPQLTVLQTQELVDEDILRIQRRHNLSFQDAARACALTTAWLVKECAPQIGADVGVRIAAFGFVEGSKTVPRTPLTGREANT